MEDTNEKLIWFVAGAALGASVALLFAPSSGEEMRRKLTEKADEGSKYLSEQGAQLVDKGRELYDQGRQLADDAARTFEEGQKLVQG